MPYKNIVFAKLEKRLLNDHRWYMMSEVSQLNYVKFILLAAETYNKIPKNLEAIKKAFKTEQSLETLKKSVEEIKKSFPKLKENEKYFLIAGFKNKVNYIPKYKQKEVIHDDKLGNPKEIPGKSQGLPKDGVDKDKDKDKEEDKDKEQPSAVQTALKTVFKEGLNIYALINRLKKESKVGAELPDEVLLRVCESYQKNKPGVKDPWSWFKRTIIACWEEWNVRQNIKQGEEFKKEGIPQSIRQILVDLKK